MRRLWRNADHGLQVLDGEPPERRQRLERMRRLYAFLEREMPKLLERFAAGDGGDAAYRPAELEANGLA
jgi:hypothetical protein